MEMMKMTDSKLVLDTINWFRLRGLDTANPIMQLPKLLEEFGETVNAIDTKDFSEITDGIGDQIVVIVGIMTQLGFTAEEILDIFSRAESLPFNTHSNIISKLVGLYGTLASSVLRGTTDKDIFITILMYLDELSLREVGKGMYISLAAAYDEIKDRLGMVVDGVYIKANDLSGDQLIVLSSRTADPKQLDAIWTLFETKFGSASCDDGACAI